MGFREFSAMCFISLWANFQQRNGFLEKRGKEKNDKQERERERERLLYLRSKISDPDTGVNFSGSQPSAVVVQLESKIYKCNYIVVPSKRKYRILYSRISTKLQLL